MSKMAATYFAIFCYLPAHIYVSCLKPSLLFFFLHFLYKAAILFCFLVIVYTHKKQISQIILQRLYIVPFFYLCNRAVYSFIPFQFDHCRRFIQIPLPRNETDIRKSLSAWQLPDDRIVLSGKIKCQINRTAECILIIILED